ncbi:glycoside hydrolase family 78 protein [Spirosoma sp. RP8]|uniref:alpha-L-rhamnosidase n=1 Tax=Spirosoma liriopis TaxID=2937440 RepID=A0ABT0HRP2_9BACT|nr:glycoside hydrolase family 78 protein [Spirosoma liriopis]MCK8494850.1 glycoside hydrolase family 78 protein [Spirosoma liriopis]
MSALNLTAIFLKPAFQIARISICILLMATTAYGQTAGKPVHLKCEHLVNPLGIDANKPRLTWRLDDSRRGAAQSAYQLTVGTDSIAVSQGQANEWTSGKLTSGQQLVRYAGKPLRPFTKYYWRVEAWDQDGVKLVTSSVASFETGMMDKKNWQGSWISDSRDINLKPAPYFRRSFQAAKKIKSARAYIAVAGLYELYINGQKVGNHRLDPMYTRFDRRTLYVTHDVTSLLQSGKNAIGVLLGNGWYNHQSTAVWYFHEAPWRGRPTFCLDLRLTYDDGSVETITSGKDWKTALSPLLFNSIYTAEHYDARLEQPGWNTANFDDRNWKDVIYRATPSETIVAQALQPIRNVERIPTKTFKKLNDTTYVFDLGRNIAGVSHIRAQGSAGTVLRLKHGERLYPNGHVDQSNIDVHYRPVGTSDPFQTDLFTLSGKGDESFMPFFNYKGFQYVEVTSNKAVELTAASLTGYFMHSDVPPIGQLKSSNPTIDKIWWATNNAYLSNLFGYPTDCPQREKNGWTGDAHIAIETGLYNFDGITVYEKWLADHRDEQQPNGVLPAIIPTGGWGYEWANGPDWTSTIAIIPWNAYLFYGDSTLLADCYDNIKRYVDHINEQSPSGLTEWGLGDWVPVKSKSPVELTSSTYYYTDVSILAKTAKLLGKEADYAYYSALADKIKSAINAKYLNRQTAQYGTGLQTELSIPLYWGLVPEELKSKVAANLARRVEADNFHLDVGLLGTKAILNALSENGYADVAYKIASQETFPSWGWWIVNGATTLYENWPIDAKSDISMNHIMFGEIGAWLFKGIGGIKPDPQRPGFKHILLKPHYVTGLNHFDATYESPYGTIRSSWKRVGKGIAYTVVVPPNSTATVDIPVASGQRVFESKKPFTQASQRGQNATSSTYTLQSGTYQFDIE